MEIVKVPAVILGKKTEPVLQEDLKNGSVQKLIADMKIVMKERQGVGLAANQVSKNMSIFIIEETLARENNVPEVYINPEITEYSTDTDEIEEGCLSIPEWYVSIRRSKKIKLKALDEHGNKLKIKARGLLARVFQHETDHLNGKTIKNLAQ